MTSSEIVNPHIYKKGKILYFKKLDDGENTSARYLFHTNQASVTSMNNLGNNLNQLTGRCLLGIHKLLSYFGLSEDPSEQFSKNETVFGKFYSILEGGDNKAFEIIEELKEELLSTQNAKLNFLEEKINFLGQKRDDIPLTREEVLNFTSKIEKIEEHLRKILG